MSLKTKRRSKKTFFEDHLGMMKEGTGKQYHYALKDFENYTKTKHKMDLEQIIKEFKKSNVNEILDILQDWINKSKIELRNRKQRVKHLNQYFYYRDIDIDPRKIKELKFRQGEPDEREPVSHENLQKIIAATKKPITKVLYFALASSGMTIGEACHIKKKDIDALQERIRISIRQSYTKGSRRGRNIYVSKETGKELKPILNRLQDNDFVFHKSRNPKVAKANEDARFRRLVDSLGIGDKYGSGTRKISFHSLRAYFFTKAMQKHGEPYAHRMTGHKGYLDVYSRWTDEEKLEKYLELEPELFVFEPKPETQQIMELKKIKEESQSEINKLKWVNGIMNHYLVNGKFPDVIRKRKTFEMKFKSMKELGIKEEDVFNN